MVAVHADGIFIPVIIIWSMVSLIFVAVMFYTLIYLDVSKMHMKQAFTEQHFETESLICS